ncbi:MAG: hypothetical protein KDA21_11770, partial [Phycisphaerales bacterium]|nr:hypothetical protein [Phycisphaerales bacterium]
AGSGRGSKDAVPRIYTMSRVHAILSKRSWSVVQLSEIIDDVVRSEQPDRADALQLTGEKDIQVEPSRCQALAMTLHEMAVNARQHGAWSVPQGHIRIDVSRTDEALTIDWIEAGLSEIAPPSGQGMGLTLVSGFVEHDLHGRVEKSFDPPGFRATIVLPLVQASFKGGWE